MTGFADLKYGQGKVTVGIMGTELGEETQWWGRGLGSKAGRAVSGRNRWV